MGTLRYGIAPPRATRPPTHHEIAVQHRQYIGARIARESQRLTQVAKAFIGSHPQAASHNIKALHYTHTRRMWQANTHYLVAGDYLMHPLTIKTSVSRTPLSLWLDYSEPGRVNVEGPLRCETCGKPSDPVLHSVDIHQYMQQAIHTELELTLFVRSFFASL